MAKNFKNLTEGEKKELTALIAKKKTKSLTETEAARLAELNEKCGFKNGKSSSKEGFRPGNDFSWWNKIPELTKDAANFKSNYIAGDKIAGNDIPFVIPGVAVFKLLSVYGSDSKATDPINVWARDLYLKMFHNYRPAAGYSASDMAIAILGGVEVTKLIAKYERIYGVVNRYSILNINMPEVEAAALGLTPSVLAYLQGHLSDFRYDLNFLLRKAQRVCVPKDLSVVADAISLFGYEYCDHNSPRSQIIIFDSANYGVYSDTALTSGGSIQFAPIQDSVLFDFDAENMCTLLVEALDALLGSDSVQRIYADLVVWFGREAMLGFVPVPDEYIVTPVYSESMLHKMHNLECVTNQRAFDLTSWASNKLSQDDQNVVLNGYYHVYQADDVIITRSAFKSTGTGLPITYDGGKVLAGNSGMPSINVCHLVDTYRVDPDPEVIVEGVMYKNHSHTVTSGVSSAMVIDSCAFYLVKDIQVWSNAAESGEDPTNRNWTNVNFDDEDTALAAAGSLAILDWAPLSYFILDTGKKYYIAKVFGDMDQVIPIYYNDLARLHRTIILSGLHTDLSTRK